LIAVKPQEKAASRDDATSATKFELSGLFRCVVAFVA